MPLEPTLAWVAERLASSGGVPGFSCWLDGNLALEDLAAARTFCASLGDTARLLIHLPPHELGAVEGLDAAEVPQAAPSAWREADALLVVGNPLATHPVAARHLLRWGPDRARVPMIVVDSSATLLTDYSPNSLVCPPGHEYWVVTALLAAANAGDDGAPRAPRRERDLGLAGSGVELDRLRPAAERLRPARRPAVILAPQAGGCDRWRAAAMIAATWARQRGGTSTVLTGHANALAAARYMRRHGIRDWASAGSQATVGDGDVLLIVGWDPSSAYPRLMWESAVRRAACVALVSTFPPADADCVDVVLPLALGSEAGGTYVLADGRPTHVSSLLPPPTGVLTISELFARLADRLAALPGSPLKGGPVRFSAAVSEDEVAAAPLSPPALPPAPPECEVQRGWPTVVVADPSQYFDGQITRHSSWWQALGALPELRVSPADVRALNLRDGQKARIRSGGNWATVRVTVVRHQPELSPCGLPLTSPEDVARPARPVGWLAVSGAAPEVRRLAGWEFGPSNEAAQSGTIHVEVEPAEAPPVAQEAVHARG
jgi:anaerobic selenocysteine-containing dehydrogenase